MAVDVRRRAVFLDKDGTLIDDVPYNVNPERMRLAPGATELLGRLGRDGYALVVVSNQSGVGRGYFPESALAGVERRLREMVTAAGAKLDAFLYCPHAPMEACPCRKPAPGMLLRAAEEHAIDLRASWMVGDILDDIEAGNRAGARTILLDIGHETEWAPGPMRVPSFRVQSLAEAVAVMAGTGAVAAGR